MFNKAADALAKDLIEMADKLESDLEKYKNFYHSECVTNKLLAEKVEALEAELVKVERQNDKMSKCLNEIAIAGMSDLAYSADYFEFANQLIRTCLKEVK